MLVRFHMSKDFITVDVDDTAVSALRTMRRLSTRHLPVMRDKRLIAMVTERDILHVLPSFVVPASEQIDFPLPLSKVPTTRLISISPNETIEHAAKLLLKYKVCGLPVMDKGKLVGLLTGDDILKTFISVFDHHHHMRLVMMRSSGASNQASMDLSTLCSKSGLKLKSLVHHAARRGAEVFVLCAEGNSKQLDAFKEAASQYAWLPVSTSKAAPSRESSHAA
jgi:CBS domain-containing protein